jgi:hypothetical protein
MCTYAWRELFGGSHKRGFLLTNSYKNNSCPMGIMNASTLPACGSTNGIPLHSPFVVDDFGVKYVGKEHANHLMKCIRANYKLIEDWSDNLYCSVKVKWDYNACTLDISMPGYVQKQLLKYKHVLSPRPQHCPYSPEPTKIGSEAQSPLPFDMTRKLSDAKIKQVQKFVGSIMYYARVVDMTVLMALSTIASKQAQGTERTMEKALQVLNYLATHPNATVCFQVSDMIMNIHSDALYLPSPNPAAEHAGIFS